MEKVEEVINRLIEKSAKGTPIVVEGKKDTEALCSLGVSGRILTMKTGGKSILAVTSEIESLGTKEVILLLDFDRRGKEGTKRLNQELERLKIKPNLKFWKDVAGLLGNEVQCVESLPSYLKTLKVKAGVSATESKF